MATKYYQVFYSTKLFVVKEAKGDHKSQWCSGPPSFGVIAGGDHKTNHPTQNTVAMRTPASPPAPPGQQAQGVLVRAGGGVHAGPVPHRGHRLRDEPRPRRPPWPPGPNTPAGAFSAAEQL